MAKHVVVLGAGFAGLNAVRQLSREPGLRVTLVDQNNYHLFLPLLYQVATAGLEAPQIAWPIRAFLRKHRNTQFLMGKAEGLEPQHQRLWVDGQPVHYDHLIIGTGSRNHDFGIAGVAQHAFGLKSLEDAMQIRDRVLSAAEEAVHTADPAKRQALLTFVIVGGGPTGVELAGALGELKRHVVVRDYPELKPEEFKVVLVEAGPRLLSHLSPSSSAYAEGFLRSLGVEVLTQTKVAQVSPQGARLHDGRFVHSHLVIWSAGVAGASLPGLPTVGAGRVATTPQLFVPEFPNIYVAGDLNYLPQANGKPLPQIAPTAMQQGSWAASNLRRALRGQDQQPFKYWDKGNMATLGRNKAVTEIKGLAIKGFPAWAAWLAVHIYYLAGARNRLMVMSNWAYSYFTYDNAVRIMHQRHRFDANVNEAREYPVVSASSR